MASRLMRALVLSANLYESTEGEAFKWKVMDHDMRYRGIYIYNEGYVLLILTILNHIRNSTTARHHSYNRSTS